MTCSRNPGRAPRSAARDLTPFEVAVSNEKPTPRCHLAGDGPAHPGCGTNHNVGHPTGPFTPKRLATRVVSLYYKPLVAPSGPSCMVLCAGWFST
jgi:hypothetical protein